MKTVEISFYFFLVICLFFPASVFSVENGYLCTEALSFKNRKTIDRALQVKVFAREHMIDSLFKYPELCARLASLFPGGDFTVHDSGTFFFIDDGSGTSGRVKKCSLDFMRNDLHYFFEGIHREGIMDIKGEMLMNIRYEQKADSVLIQPSASVFIENGFYRGVTKIMLKLPFFDKWVNSKIEKEINLVRDLGVKIINNLNKPDSYAEFKKIPADSTGILPAEYNLLDELFAPASGSRAD
ncbi:MAG: hypothetical protein ACLFQK_01575 [Fibrobacterota bacterium]